MLLGVFFAVSHPDAPLLGVFFAVSHPDAPLLYTGTLQSPA